MSEIKTCPKCQSEMEKGTYTTVGGFSWASDSEQGVWDKLKKPLNSNIVAFKCKECGFLENFVE